MTFTTDYDRQIKSQSETFEDRLCDAILENKSLDSLMIEAKEILRIGYFTPTEYKNFTDIEMYKEILS